MLLSSFFSFAYQNRESFQRANLQARLEQKKPFSLSATSAPQRGHLPTASPLGRAANSDAYCGSGAVWAATSPCTSAAMLFHEHRC